LNVLGYSIVLGLSGRHPIEEFGERWCGGRETSVGPHVEGAAAVLAAATTRDNKCNESSKKKRKEKRNATNALTRTHAYQRMYLCCSDPGLAEHALRSQSIYKA
jgi:hypothetical protein